MADNKPSPPERRRAPAGSLASLHQLARKAFAVGPRDRPGVPFRRQPLEARAQKEQEERLRLVLEATNDGIWDVDLNSGHVSVNDRFFEMLGYAPGELEPQFESLLSAIHPDDQTFVRTRFEEHLRSGAPYVADFRMRGKDGSWLWIQGRGKVVARDHEGRPLRVVGTNSDIQARKLEEQARVESNRRLSEAERVAALGHWEYDIVRSTFTWSTEHYRIFGFEPGAPLPDVKQLAKVFHPDDAPEFLRAYRHLLETGQPVSFTLRIIRLDGSLRWLFSEARAERDATGQIVRCFGTTQDVTKREEAQQRLRQAARVFDSIDDAVIITGPDHQILAVNDAFSRLTGFPKHAVTGLALEAVLQSANDSAFWGGLWMQGSERRHWQGERWERRQNGTAYRARIGVTVLDNEQGRVDSYIIVVGDITRLRETQDQLDCLANFDPLTGLANRNRFRARLTQALQNAERKAGQTAVLLLDLDRFRIVNQSLGPAGADEVLKTIGNALTSALSPADTVARLGSDEFGVILPEICSTKEITEIAGHLQQCCADQRVFSGRLFSVTASIGIAVYPIDGVSADALMRHADVALKEAKRRDRQRIEYFETAMAYAPQERLHLEACLSQAVLRGELELHYQPQVQLGTGRLVGAEALLRWNNDELGRVNPAQFIPVAEDMGLIQEIGSWVLRNAAQQLISWDRRGQGLPRLAVNLSVIQLEYGDLVDEIAAILANCGLDPARLELEITESLIMSQAEHPAATLEALRDLGVCPTSRGIDEVQ